MRSSSSRTISAPNELFTLVESTLHNKAREALWGSRGTLIAAIHMLEATKGTPEQARWLALFRQGIDRLWQQMVPARHSTAADREIWLWQQELYGESLRYFGAGHGFAGNLYPVVRGAPWLDDAVVAAFEARAQATLHVAADREPGLVNWEPVFDPAASGFPKKPLVQD